MGITSGKAAKAVENQRARKLYEEIFDEDSPAFVDYYFRVKAAENEIFVVENEKQEILATLHLNPYEMMFCDGNPLRLDEAGHRKHQLYSTSDLSSVNGQSSPCFR